MISTSNIEAAKLLKVDSQKATDTAKLDVATIISMYDQAYMKVFAKKFKDGEDNESRWLASNWSAEMEEKHKEQNRQSYSMPLITSKIRAIAATFRDSRREYLVEASQDPADEIKASLATLKLRSIASKSNAKYTDMEVVDSGLGVMYGATETYIDYSSKYPCVKYRKLDYKDVIWDVNSKAYNPREDALWMATIEKMYRYEIEALPGIDPNDIPSDEISTSFSGRETSHYHVQRDAHGNNAYDVITVYHHYQRVLRDVYIILFDDPANLLTAQNNIVYEEFEKKAEAEAFLNKAILMYADADAPLPDSLAESLQKKQKVFIDRYDLIYNKIIDYEETALEMIPIDMFFSFRFEDKFISMMDFMKSPQIFLDRMWSQIDFSLGTELKKIFEINESQLSERNPAEKVVQIAKMGGFIFKKTNEQIIHQTEGKGINPQLMQVASIMQSYLEDVGGGRSFQGLQEGSNESGVAIARKQQAGLMVALLFMDNFNRYLKARGENLLHWTKKFDTIENTIRVQGAELSPEMLQTLQNNGIYTPSKYNTGGYIHLNQPSNELSFLDDAEFELTVTETQPSDERKIIKREQMMMAMNVYPEFKMAPTFREEFVGTFDFGANKMNKILSEVDQIMAMQQQAEQKQQEISNLQQIAGMVRSGQGQKTTGEKTK